MRKLRYGPAFALACTVALLTSCAATRKQPGTGDIAFRLIWSGPVDLDLHVRDPLGFRLSFLNPSSPSGGILDIDCNKSPHDICETPVENVFWPTGNAPEGKYRYWVELFQPHFGVESAQYTLLVLIGERVVERYTGRLDLSERKAGPFEYVYRRRAPRSNL